MDTRQRFRRLTSENNIAPNLHQRHKSTGSLAGMVSAAAAGFRGPAKRAAFGDVTNTSRHSTAHDDAKVALKVQPAAVSTLGSTGLNLNKENTSYSKDSLSRAALRHGALGNKIIKPLSESQSIHAPKPPHHQHRPLAQQHLNAAANVPPSRHSRENQDQVAALVQANTSYAAKQPRHYKSQPQLKLQQPSLRRTQSKFFEKIDYESTHFDIPEEPEFAEMQVPAIEQASGHTVYFDTGPYHIDSESQQPAHAAESVSHAAGVSAVAEARPTTSHSYKESSYPALSEPEEWDEEEDEEYEDQDQAYTTANSFRSRDYTTVGATTLLAPRLTARVQRELEEARVEVENSRFVADFEDEVWDVSMVAELTAEQIKMLPNPHYMEMQTEIQWSMRSVLMDWLVQVHSRFTLLPETLYLTVNYIDRFLSYKIISVTKLQLVGATALLVASKYEEINCPSMDEIVFMVDNGYSPEEILKAERFMLSMLNFELGWPGPMSFLRRVSKADDYDLDTRTLAKYFLELTIMDERFVASPPSFLAAGAHCLSRLILQKGDWTKAHVYFSGYTWSQLKPLVMMLVECCEHPHRHHAAVYEKYSEKRFKEAATIVQHALDIGFTLPHHTTPMRALKSQPVQPHDSLEHLQYTSGLLPPIEG
ncbi:G2 mitotic-specific cyclin (Clb3) [Cordyceps militaris]|uniref:G2 mitotic-specific cyclin (Clb3) n=1 Tax=Cordyceps militaris TaxID=73501 RepID=A0A2H4S8U6_CORMI|nr:G2 mitotic-specific cyclin (Clb3) [Cordyceps militaris]